MSGGARSRRAVALASALVASLTACAHPTPPATPAPRHDARFEDALDGPPDLLLLVRPRAIARDRIYGPLFRRLTTLAAERTHTASIGTTALAAFERSDEAMIVAYDRAGRDAMIVLRGTPADVDAAAVVDASGHRVWDHPHDLPGGVTEYAQAEHDPSSEGDALLFVLPRRVWVMAIGGATSRAHAVFALDRAPSAASATVDDDAALAVLRLRGDALAQREIRLRVGPLAPIGRDLDFATFALEPGRDAPIVAKLVYAAQPSATDAEARLRDVLGAFTRKFGDRHEWLNDVTIAGQDRAVTLRGTLPPSWVGELVAAEESPLDAPEAAPAPQKPANSGPPPLTGTAP